MTVIYHMYGHTILPPAYHRLITGLLPHMYGHISQLVCHVWTHTHPMYGHILTISLSFMDTLTHHHVWTHILTISLSCMDTHTHISCMDTFTHNKFVMYGHTHTSHVWTHILTISLSCMDTHTHPMYGHISSQLVCHVWTHTHLTL